MSTEAQTVEAPPVRWISCGRAAEIMQVSNSTVHARRKAGVIRAQLKAGGPQYLFHGEDVEKFRPKE